MIGLSSSLLRILTKWCEELESNFEDVDMREEPFRMKNGNENFINSTDLKVLKAILLKEKQKVSKYVEQLVANNYEQQCMISK